MGRNNGFKKTQAWSPCAESAHNAKTCKIELGDHARRPVDEADCRPYRVSRVLHGHAFLFHLIHSAFMRALKSASRAC